MPLQVLILQTPNPFPTAKEIDESDDVIDGSASYTISHVGAIDNADSIYFSIYGPDATVLKRMGAGTTSASISASEMSSLGKRKCHHSNCCFQHPFRRSIWKETIHGKRGRSFKNRKPSNNCSIPKSAGLFIFWRGFFYD